MNKPLRLALTLGGAAAAWAAAVNTLSGGLLSRKYGLSTAEMVLGYVILAVTVGVIAGHLATLTRSPLGAIVTGFIAVAPAAALFYLALMPHLTPGMVLVAAAATGLVLGAGGGWIYWQELGRYR